MKAKTISTIILLILTINLFAQKDINYNNYYDYYSIGKNLKGSRLTTAWLNKYEVAKIIEHEMTRIGFQRVSTFQIVKIDSVNVVLSVCFSQKSNFGFLYVGGHSGILTKEDDIFNILTVLAPQKVGQNYS